MNKNPNRKSIDEIAEFIRNFPLNEPGLDREELYANNSSICETLWQYAEKEQLIDFGILTGVGSAFEYAGKAIIVL